MSGDRDTEQRVYEILAKRQRREKLTRKEESILAYTYFAPRTCRCAVYPVRDKEESE